LKMPRWVLRFVAFCLAHDLRTFATGTLVIVDSAEEEVLVEDVEALALELTTLAAALFPLPEDEEEEEDEGVSSSFESEEDEDEEEASKISFCAPPENPNLELYPGLWNPPSACR